MKTPIRYLLFCSVTLLLSGCVKRELELPVVPVERVLLVYFAADNNLSDNVQVNLDGLMQGMAAAGGAKARIVAYLDTPGERPRLAEVTAAGTKELYRWPSAQNSASPEVMREVIDRVRRTAPAGRYGLVLWSHGMAWVPSSATGYFVKSYQRSAGAWPATKDETRSLPRRGPMEKETTGWPATKYFGQDTGVTPEGYLETADLAAAIPDGMFDYILFDACFMASVEVEYALRDKADWIIAAPTEVIADGFPYADITGELLRRNPDLQAVCETYYNHYAQHARPTYRSATVSLVTTAQLEALATATAELYGAALVRNPAVFSDFDLRAVQPMDRYRRHFLFDLDDITARLEATGAVSSSEAARWREQLGRTIRYNAHTDAFFDLPLRSCCGLSGYIPATAYPDLNDYYKTLDWYGATVHTSE